jgi:hypothetical protein
MLLAGQAYDAFISPAILNELEEVLSELRFNVPALPCGPGTTPFSA